MPSRIAIDDPEATYAWKINQVARCSICLDQRADWYEVHHIIKRGRSDEPCNYLLLCDRCHRAVEGHRIKDRDGAVLPPLGLCHALYAKMDQNPGEYSYTRLLELHGRPLPGPHVLPLEWQAISARNDPFNISRKH